MSDQLTPDEIELLLHGVTVAPEPESTDPQLLADLLGGPLPTAADDVPSDAAPATPQPRRTPNPRSLDQENSDGRAWETALHLVPGYESLCRRHPPITERQDPKHGRVLVGVYLEDKVRGIRRNMKIGGDMFFDAEALAEITPDTQELQCRIVIKVFEYKPGTQIRFWENHRVGGDAPGKSGTVLVSDAGLRLQRSLKGK